MVQRRRDRTTGAGSARRVHTRRVARARTARACSAKQRPPAQTAAQRSPCRLVHACDSSSGSARVLAHIRSAHSAWAARITVQLRATPRLPAPRFLPWRSFPPRGGVRRRPRRAPAALETSRRPGRALTRRDDLGRSEASRQVIHGYACRFLRTRARYLPLGCRVVAPRPEREQAAARHCLVLPRHAGGERRSHMSQRT